MENSGDLLPDDVTVSYIFGFPNENFLIRVVTRVVGAP